MNGINHSNEDVVECPLCMEPLEVDDLNFFPCTCGYQICRFCWHRIRTDENELCPACRKAYPENPADFTPLTQEQIIFFKSQKRQRDQQKKQKITENRKHLANVRVVQKNLVFVVGLPPRLADADILKKHEYFGKYGKIHKVVINPSTTYAGVQGPSASAYVTYVHNNDALRAIQSVNNITIDGRQIKTSLGTTKYCSHFMKNQQCPKGDCMYLHELGDPEASFTKEEMHQGKHQEYEKRLHDALIATAGASTAGGMGVCVSGTIVTSTSSTASVTLINNGVSSATSSNNSTSICKNGDAKLTNGSSSNISPSSSLSTSSSSTSSTSSAGTATGGQGKDAWPSLSVSPVNSKESVSSHNTGQNHTNNSKSKKEKAKHDKSKCEKNGKRKNNNGGSNHNQSSNNNGNHNSNMSTSSRDTQCQSNGLSESFPTPTIDMEDTISTITIQSSSTSGTDKTKALNKNDYNSTLVKNDMNKSNQHRQKQQQNSIISADDEIKLIQNLEKSKVIKNGQEVISSSALKDVDNRSLSSSSSNSSDNTSSTLSESTSGKSSPGSFSDLATSSSEKFHQQKVGDSGIEKCSDVGGLQQLISSTPASPSGEETVNGIEGHDNLCAPISPSNNEFMTNEEGLILSSATTTAALQLKSTIDPNNVIDTNACFSKLNLFDDNNSFFSSSSSSFQQSLLFKGKLENEMRSGQNSSLSHLPDLLNGIHGYQNNKNEPTSKNEKWETEFKTFMLKNNAQIEENLLLQQPQQQDRPHQQQMPNFQQQAEVLRLQEFHKQNFIKNMGLAQLNGPHNDFSNINSTLPNTSGTDLSRLSQTTLIQQQQQERHQQSLASDHLLGNNLFGTNMSKFFDFHKNQQQIHHQQLIANGHSGGNTSTGSSNEHLRFGSLLENNRINSQFSGQSNGILQQQQSLQLSKQRLLNKYDPMVGGTYNLLMNLNSNSVINQQLPQQQPQQHLQPPQQQSVTSTTISQLQQNRLPNQFPQNSCVDDDLGFDPFIETQKALAELMENEMQQNTNTQSVNNKLQQTIQHQQQHQQQLLENIQRTRMPPPGFNHMNAFGFGVPRPAATSKILPFMNMGLNGQHPNQQQMQIQQQQQNNWNTHLSGPFQQQSHIHPLETQMHINQQQTNNVSHNKGYSNNDWTAMDPAILSFRQFSSFPQQQQQQQQMPPMPHHPQQPQQQHSGPTDMFMQHLTQQQSGFASQHHNNVNLATSLINQQQSSQSQVNFPHSNWLNSEQSLFMNSLTNGFVNNNNYDKFAIPMPPGIHQNNLNKQQKAECIN